jgi:hypothetical protein
LLLRQPIIVRFRPHFLPLDSDPRDHRQSSAAWAVRVDGEWLILDNRTLSLVRDTDLTRAIPELILDQAGVRRFCLKTPEAPGGG